MASNIVSETIDQNYPVAGVDNDTQGFRDNFTIIRSNFAYAKEEIETLQDNTVKLNETNNFNGSKIYDTNLQASTWKYHNAGTLVAGQNISFLNGHYQTITISSALDDGTNALTLTLSDWPAGEDTGVDYENRYAHMRLELLLSDGSVGKTVTWAIENSGLLYKESGWDGTTIVGNADSPTIVEFWTYDGGQTVYGRRLGLFEA